MTIGAGRARSLAFAVILAIAVGVALSGCASGSSPTASPTGSAGIPITSSQTDTTGPTATGTASRPSPSTAATTRSGSTRPGPSRSSPAVTFQASGEILSPALRARMTGVSWHAGCPVGLDRLRLLRLSYWGFDGQAHTGELVVNAAAVTAVTRAFARIFAARFAIRQMRLVDDFGGDDERSMVADNTSAFNCRLVPGTGTWAQHAYGLAVDVNPFENPMMTGGRADPAAAAAWGDRSRTSPAMIRHGDEVWQAFRSVGWYWGGDWTSPKDYQHFSANGY